MARPGEMDFAKLAKEARASLDSSTDNAKKVKVAASEGGVPAPQNADVNDGFDDDSNVVPDEVVEVAEDAVEEIIDNTPADEGESEETSEPAPEVKKKEPKKFEDDDEVVIKVDGVEQTVTYKEYKDRIRKEATVTQRMQNLAESRKQLEAEVAAAVAQLEARERALQAKPQVDPNAQALQALVDLLSGKAPAKQKAPDEVLSYGELQAELKRQQEEFNKVRLADKEEQQNTLAAAAEAARREAAANRERQQYFNGLDSILNRDEYKPLQELIPNFRASIMFHANSMGPTNLAEALEVSEDFIKQQSEKFKKLTTAQAQQKQKTAAKQKMESNDGTATSVAKKQETSAERGKKYVGKSGKLDFAAMRRDAMAQINSMN